MGMAEPPRRNPVPALRRESHDPRNHRPCRDDAPRVAGLRTVGPPDKSVDRGIDSQGDLSGLQAGIWIDPNGCDHWIIDDGVEGT